MISKKIKSKDGKGYKVIHTLRSTQRENLLTVTSRYFYEEQRFPIDKIVQACYTVLGNLGKGHGTPSTSNYVLSEENSQQLQISARQPTPQPNSAQFCLMPAWVTIQGPVFFEPGQEFKAAPPFAWHLPPGGLDLCQPPQD